MSIKQGAFEDLPTIIQPNWLVLDVGGGAKPVSRANYVLDFCPWNESVCRDPYFRDIWPKPYFSQETWITWDLCSRQPFPFKDKQFDFVICRHTLEDLRDPLWVCQELVRIAKQGYVETPSRIAESMLGVERTRYCGYSHHHWLCDVTAEGIEFTYKHAQIHGYRRFHLTVGPDWKSPQRHHNWREAFDFLESIFIMVNRWFRKMNPKYLTAGFYWADSFKSSERILIDKGDVEQDLMDFKRRCLDLPDLWLWKRKWGLGMKAKNRKP